MDTETRGEGFERLVARVDESERRARRRTLLLITIPAVAAMVWILTVVFADPISPEIRERVRLSSEANMRLVVGDVDSARVLLGEAIRVRAAQDSVLLAEDQAMLGLVRYAGGEFEGGRGVAEEVLGYVTEYARGNETLKRVFLPDPLLRVAPILEGDAEYAVADSMYAEALRLHWSCRDRPPDDCDVPGFSRDLVSLFFAGSIARIRHEDSTAVTYYLRAGDMTSLFPGQRLHAAVLHQLGVLHGRLRRHDEAADFLRSEVEVRREEGTGRGLGVALASLAESEMAIGDTTGAEPMLREALQVFEADGDELRVQAIRARIAELFGEG